MEDTNCEFRSECCEELPTGQVSFDWSTDLGSRWGGTCSSCGDSADFSCYEHIGCDGENLYPIVVGRLGRYFELTQLVKPEFSGVHWTREKI